MNRRLQVMKWSLARRTTGGPLSTWFKNMAAADTRSLALKVIEDVETDGDYLVFKLRNCSRPLYYPQGLPLAPLHQTIAEQWYAWQWHFYEEPETRVEPGEVVFDCGAAEGVFSLAIYARAQKVVVFEPLPEFVRSLRKTFQDVENVTICESALGDQTAHLYLERNGIASAIVAHPTSTEILVQRADDFVARENIGPTYIKADIEGYEIKMLEGAKECIRTYGPKIAITTYHVASHAEEITRLLKHINPRYRIRVKGVEERAGAPVMLHAAL